MAPSSSSRIRSFLACLTLGLVFPAIVALPAAGQNTEKQTDTLSGIVVDAMTGAPLIGVWVGIDGSRSDAYTDRDGRFAIHGIRTRAFTLVAEQLGYKDASVDIAEVNDQPIRIELKPDPVLLEGIKVVSNRLAARRNAIATDVRAYDADQLVGSASFDAYDFLLSRLFTAPCPRASFSSVCVRRRGSVIVPQIYVDDAPYFGGFDVLLGWDMTSLYSIEVIASGAQVRVYTKAFAQRLAQGKTRLMPVIW
jgi:CarboxypepD_reg-like domain